MPSTYTPPSSGAGGRVVERVLGKTPWASQLRFHRLKTRYKGFSGPIGSGKSQALVYEAIKLAVINAGRLGFIGAPTYPMLRDVTERAFFEELQAAGIPYSFNRAEHHMRLTELGSEIVFRSLDNPDRLRGTNLAWFGVDELTYTMEDAWERLEGRLRDPRAKHLCGFGVWTPNGYDWVYERFIRDTPANYPAIIAKPGENKALPPDFYSRLADSYDERFYRQEVLGEYLNIFAGRAYYAFDRDLDVGGCDYDDRYPVCWSLDFNVSPMSSVIAQLIDISTEHDRMMNKRRVQVHVIDELFLKDSNTPAACEAFYERVRPWLSPHRSLPVRVYGDATSEKRTTATAGAPSDWDAVRKFFSLRGQELSSTFLVGRSNPLVKDRVAVTNMVLCSQAGVRSARIDPRCKYLIRDLERVAWKPGSAELDKGSDKDLTHVSDAFGYLAAREFRLGGQTGEKYMPGGLL